MNLIFLSSDPISLPSLEELANGKISGIRITAVVTNPDRRSGRGKKIQRNVVAAKAEELGLPVLQTSKLTTDQCRSLPEFDAALVYAFGQILPRSVLSLKPNRFLNIHASPLPRLRGPSPIETAIAEGWMTTEISLMRMVLRMDAGDVAHRQTVEITRTDTGRSLREKIAHVSASLVHRIPEALSDEAHWERQVDSNATWCRKISKQDASLDLSLPATVLADRARAFSGWPGSTLQIHGEGRYWQWIPWRSPPNRRGSRNRNRFGIDQDLPDPATQPQNDPIPRVSTNPSFDQRHRTGVRTIDSTCPPHTGAVSTPLPLRRVSTNGNR